MIEFALFHRNPELWDCAEIARQDAEKAHRYRYVGPETSPNSTIVSCWGLGKSTIGQALELTDHRIGRYRISWVTEGDRDLFGILSPIRESDGYKRLNSRQPFICRFTLHLLAEDSRLVVN